MSEFEPTEFKSEEEWQAALEYEKSVEIEKPEPFDSVVVLGGGLKDPLWKTNPKLEKSEGWMLPFDAKMRTIAATQMYLDGLTKEIIFTGGKTATDKGIEVSEAEKMKEYAGHILQNAGIEDDKINKVIVLEDKATNTIENVANVCNIIDQDKEKYQNLAVLSNEYHLDRAQKLMEKFGLKTQGISAEEKVLDRSEKYQKVLDRFFQSPEYRKKLAVERRFSAGLQNLPRYWFPQAMAVNDPDRLYQIMESIYGPALAQKLGKKAVLESKDDLNQIERKMPPEEWGES
ncbi:MAG: YdcF family protein [Patescibacteria group bacterium]|nr:YdcF family protein [Patescibacteria group bacterium]